MRFYCLPNKKFRSINFVPHQTTIYKISFFYSKKLVTNLFFREIIFTKIFVKLISRKNIYKKICIQVDESWWQGLHQKTGKEGLFPANYVQINENLYMNVEETSHVRTAGSNNLYLDDNEEIYETVQ